MSDFSRYIRQMTLAEVGLAGQQRLAQARVLLVGAGGLGAPVLQYLVAAGVGQITLVDHDCLELTNLHRQVIYTAEDLGRPKVEAAQARMAALNPDCNLIPLQMRLSTRLARELVPRHDVVIDAADTLAVTYALSDTCLAAGKPLISASVVSLSGYVGRFCAGSPSYRALFPLMPETAGSCDTLGVLGSAVGVMGSLQAHLAMQEILGLGERSARLLTVDFRTLKLGGFDFSTATEPAGPAWPLVGRDELLPSDIVIELRDATEAADLPVDWARRLQPSDLAGADLPSGRRIVLCCRTGLRSTRAAHALADKGHDDLAIAALG